MKDLFKNISRQIFAANPSEGVAEGGFKGGIPPRPSVPAPPPCSFRAEPSKKVFFSFYLPALLRKALQAGKEKSGAHKSKNAKKTFLRGGER